MIVAIGSSAFADVGGARYSSGIDPFKGVEHNVKKEAKENSNETLPTIKVGSELHKQIVTKSYMSCESKSGQKFQEGQFGYDQCLNEKKDESRVRGLATDANPVADPQAFSLENLKINLDHTFTF